MMKELTLAQNFSAIALNAQDSRYRSMVKTVALRCVAAAVVLETWLDGSLAAAGEKGAPPLTLYREIVLEPLLLRRTHDRADLKWWLSKASGLPARQLEKLEHAIADSLKGLNLLEEIPNLLGCDMFYDTSGNTIMEYRTATELYTRVIESIRAEVLEEGELSDETIAMLWLLRECGGLNEVFSKSELDAVAKRMAGLYQDTPLGKLILTLDIRRGFEMLSIAYLSVKRLVFRSQVGTGVAFSFPLFERSQSIFIDTEAWFENKEQRLADLEARLTRKGHCCTTLRAGVAPMIKIDNLIYEAIPTAIGGRVPIQGMRLRKYPL